MLGHLNDNTHNGTFSADARIELDDNHTYERVNGESRILKWGKVIKVSEDADKFREEFKKWWWNCNLT